MRIEGIEEKTFRVIELISKIDILFLFGMMSLMVADVLLRLLAGLTIPGIFELVELGMILVVYLGLAATQTSKMNISVDFFVSRLPKIVQRVLDLLNYLISLFMAGLIGYRGFVYLQHLIEVERDSDVLHIPVFFQLFSVVGWILLTLAFLIDFVKSMQRWKTNE